MGGEIEFSNGSTFIQFEGLSFESFGTNNVITATEYVNGSYVNRVVLFTLSSNPFGAPFAITSFNNFTGIQATASTNLINALGSVYGITVSPGTLFATVSVNTRLQTVS